MKDKNQYRLENETMGKSNNTNFSTPSLLPSALSIIHKKQASLGGARNQGYKFNSLNDNNLNTSSIENEESTHTNDIDSVSGKFV